MSIDKGGREHRAAGQGGAQRVTRIEGGLGTPLTDLHPCRAQQRPLDLGEAVHRCHRGQCRRQHPPGVGGLQAAPGPVQLVGDKPDLHGEHDRQHDENRPANPPVLPPAFDDGLGSGVRLGVVRARVRAVRVGRRTAAFQTVTVIGHGHHSNGAGWSLLLGSRRPR
ncbi:Uncharacterised protein [Mycobacteroides abscessus subsp. massiliense]|nr:Uncharacterised protein [Mycobacteroides abscessus subsp. massiliense]